MRLVVLVGLLAALGVAAARAPAADLASRTVDRTFVCKPVAFGGVGDLDVLVTPPLQFTPTSPPIASYLLLSSAEPGRDSNLVFVRARTQRQLPGSTHQTSYGGPGGVFAHTGRCAPARTRVALSPRGLPGSPTVWERDLDCPVRGRVLIRVRAALRAPANWRKRADGAYAGALQTVVSASLAARSERSRAAIAYMELDAKGEVKLWHSPGCS